MTRKLKKEGEKKKIIEECKKDIEVGEYQNRVYQYEEPPCPDY